MGGRGGIFVNYRRGPHLPVVQELRERLVQHFGADHVFFDTSSIIPGRRYSDELRERLADCEVLLVVIHEGWLDARDESGRRRLDRADDWVRREIEGALAAGKVVIPLLLDGAVVPLPSQLPESMADLVMRQAQSLSESGWHADLAQLCAVLEVPVKSPWTALPCPAPPKPPPGRWLGIGTAALAAALLMALVLGTLADLPENPGSDRSDGATDVPLAFMAAGWSVLLMCAPVLAVLAVRGVSRWSVNDWERELQAVPHTVYVRRTYLAAVALVLLALLGAFTLREQGILPALGVLLVVIVSVAHTAAGSLRTQRMEAEQWRNWPHALPSPVTRQQLRRAVARLEARARGWSHPLSRQQREKAQWVLQDFEQALAAIRAEGGRSRLTWLRREQPWLFSLYALWVTLNTGLTTAAVLPVLVAGDGSGRLYALPVIAALLSGALGLATMEIAYRQQRWLRSTVVREAEIRVAELAVRVTELSSLARTRPTRPAPRPEDQEEPD
ncbi:toll/interleukin-1 receptor domain-containing protein [Streptomyces sp. NPDC059076]